MNEELFQRTFSKLEASGQAKEELLQMMESKTKQSRRPVFRAARLAAIAAAAMCLLAATAFAASGSFRGAVLGLLFPRYGQSELIEIDEGHRTGSFDRADTLNTFLEKFDRENLGDGVTAKMADGFHKEVLAETEDTTAVAVELSGPDACLVVFMSRQDYGETTGLWQVTGYSVVYVDENGQITVPNPDGAGDGVRYTVRFQYLPLPEDGTE